MALGVKFIRQAGIMISKPVALILIFMYVIQTTATVFLLFDYVEKKRISEKQQAQIVSLQEEVDTLKEKLKIFEVIKDFQIGFSDEEVARIGEVLYAESKGYSYDPFLLIAMIMTESSFRKGQISEVGAQGLMQIRPSVGKDVAERYNLGWEGEYPLFRPSFNIRIGSLYLFELILKFKDVKKALIAYNIGEGALRERISLGMGLPKLFVSRIKGNYLMLKEKYEESSDSSSLGPVPGAANG
jgi:soluble lytic murein transglycosylase